MQTLNHQADLDASPILRGLPISLQRIDIHAEWVSPAILALLGDLPDHIDGGEIVRDENGEPTGVFVSHTGFASFSADLQVDNAIGLIEAIRPVWTDQQREAFLGIATADAVSKGLTAIHDARAPKADLAFYSS
jgi:predicted amidohydrolase YtcJ